MKLTTAIGSALLAALTLGASAKNIGTLTLGYKNGTVVQIPVVDEPWCNKITDDTSIVQYVQLDADYDSTGDQEITCYLPDKPGCHSNTGQFITNALDDRFITWEPSRVDDYTRNHGFPVRSVDCYLMGYPGRREGNQE